MLQHESQEQAAATPAAQIRVTSEELAQAINALEAREDEAARHLAGTVPIGEVVAELKLEATPEEVWAQVQRQRAQAAQEEAARVRQAAVPVVPVTRDVQRLAASGARLVADQGLALDSVLVRRGDGPGLLRPASVPHDRLRHYGQWRPQDADLQCHRERCGDQRQRLHDLCAWQTVKRDGERQQR